MSTADPTPVTIGPPPRMVEVTIDGQVQQVPEGSTLLDAARAMGADIPTLCYGDTLTPKNACRVCMVEVEGARVLAPSCSRKVEPGMVVHTDSPRARLARRMVLEFLASSVDMSAANPEVGSGWSTTAPNPSATGRRRPPWPTSPPRSTTASTYGTTAAASSATSASTPAASSGSRPSPSPWPAGASTPTSPPSGTRPCPIRPVSTAATAWRCVPPAPCPSPRSSASGRRGGGTRPARPKRTPSARTAASAAPCASTSRTTASSGSPRLTTSSSPEGTSASKDDSASRTSSRETDPRSVEARFEPVLPSAPVLAVLAALPRGTDVVVVRDGPSWVIGVEPTQIMVARGEDAFVALDGLDRGWWAGFLAYDLGRVVERIAPRIADQTGLPDLALARFDARLILSPEGMRVEGRGPPVRCWRPWPGGPPTGPDTLPPGSGRGRRTFPGRSSRRACARSSVSSRPASAIRSTSPAGSRARSRPIRSASSPASCGSTPRPMPPSSAWAAGRWSPRPPNASSPAGGITSRPGPSRARRSTPTCLRPAVRTGRRT